MERPNRERMIWIAVGIVAGLCIAHVWPHETVEATTSDRNDKFAILTVPTGVLGGVDSVFILDFLTGQLVGATMDPQAGKFTRYYVRSIAADFGVKPRSKPYYAISSGFMPFIAAGKTGTGNGVLYIAELTSGKVAAYAFPYEDTRTPLPAAIPIAPIDIFAFREVAPAQ